jgi:hypothetical protein
VLSLKTAMVYVRSPRSKLAAMTRAGGGHHDDAGTNVMKAPAQVNVIPIKRD